MRCWHYGILEALPELQLRSQWRECIAIAKDLHETGFTHHLLINRIMGYNKEEFNAYCYLVLSAMIKRGISPKEASCMKLHEYTGFVPNKNLYVFDNLYNGWHTKEYLRSNMANLWEKHFMGVGKSKITDEEWETLCRGYKEITGEEYQI
jgi:uncharacterized protein (TIGR02328 family)